MARTPQPALTHGGAVPDLLQDRVVAAIGDIYDIEAEIGRGGSAVVYRAMDVRLRRRVAVKVLPPELAYREEVRSRFHREAQTAAQLGHPNIVPIYLVDERDGLAYFVMQLVDGESLAGLLRREPRPPIAMVRRLLREVSDALAHAHAHGVIHRDVKPDNILLDAESGRAMVTDFGIARAIEEGSRLTLTGIAVGTPAYMSPEQALGEREVDARSDIYSLGVVAYQMLAGEPPFRASNTPAMLMKHISDTPAPLAPLRPDVPPALLAAVERALAKKPEDRWPDLREFRDAILSDERPAARPSRPTPPIAHAAPAAPAAPTAAPSAAASGHPVEDAGPFGPLDAAPPPPVPAFPSGDSPTSRELWRGQQRAWREQVRAHERARQAAGTDEARGGLLAMDGMRHDGMRDHGMLHHGMLHHHEDVQPRSLAERFEMFRRRSKRAAITITVLTFINIVTVPIFPWVIFPAMGILGRLKTAWRPLRDAGVTVGDVLSGSLPSHLGGRDVAAERQANQEQAREVRAAARVEGRRQRRLVYWRNMPALEKRARVFRTASFAAGGGAAVALVSATIGAGFDVDALVAPFVMGLTTTGAGLPVAAWASRKLRRAGVQLRGLLRADWLTHLRAADPRGPDELMAEELRRLSTPEVLAGPHGEIVRRAVRDRLEVREAFARMTPTDRALLPDVTATVDALVDRVGMLAQVLHRLDADRPEAMLAVLETRLAQAERESAGTPERERRMALLQRQRITLTDLVARRAKLAGQLDSAALVLQSVRLDLLKLRSAGVDAALGDVTNATQEARALSRDIGHLLAAVDEVRSL
ncbi:MAG: serine/threonine-protein kinase [Gemmatimonadaceae bacterium]